MFYLNVGYQWVIPALAEHGVCISAQGVDATRVLARDTSELPSPAKRLFDPQLYLRNLDYAASSAVVGRLATYPWMNPGASRYHEDLDSRQWKQDALQGIEQAWPLQLPQDDGAIQACVKQCVELQNEFGVASILLPTPLIRDPESDFSEQAHWIDCGLEAIPEDNELPVLTTVAISDTCIVQKSPSKSELLAIIVDQVGARNDLDGVYLVLERIVTSDSIYLDDQKAAWALLSLCYDLGTRLSLTVIVNYAGVFGLACMAVGAESFCGGPTTKSRRLCLADYEARGGGGAFPKLYVPSLFLELTPRDIEEKIVEKRLLHMVDGDQTKYSASLFQALKDGKDLGQVGDWREHPNNTTVSHHHYVESLIRQTEKLLTSNNRLTAVLTWLQDAERNAEYLAERCSDNPLRTEYRHVQAWRSAFESFLDQRGL